MLTWKSFSTLAVFLPLSLSTACSKAPQFVYRGLPERPIPQSFKLSLSSVDSKVAQAHGEAIAKAYGCALRDVQSLAWADGPVSEDLQATYQLRFKDCPSEKLDAMLQSFAARPGVKAIEAESEIRLGQSDPEQIKQNYLPAIRRDAACSALGANKREITVAIIDSGVDARHPDLLEAFKRNPNGTVIGANFVGKGARGEPDDKWDDSNGHGTHVAGIVAATAGNQIGIAGVAACASVRILPVRVMDAKGSGSSLEIDRGIQWALANGADIINLSLGSNASFPSPQTRHPSALFAEAARRGVVVIAAAGNDGLTLGENKGRFVYSFPASYEQVISVAALNSRDELTGFSNRGETVDIAAPGEGIFSTYPPQTYKALSGTSMAAPIAAGTLALALAEVPADRSPTVDAVEQAMLASHQKENLEGVRSRGPLDALMLMQSLGKKTEPAAPVTPAPEEKEASPVAPQSMSFVGLKSGQSLGKAQTLVLKDWPQGTARVQLYWLSGKQTAARAFASLSSLHLSEDRKTLATEDRYQIVGSGALIAEAQGSFGQRLALTRLELKGF